MPPISQRSEGRIRDRLECRSTGPRGESEPFFACFSDPWIEGVGGIKLLMKLLDDRLGLIQMADIVFRRKLGSSSREPLEHKRLDPFHISALAIHVDIVKHVA